MSSGALHCIECIVRRPLDARPSDMCACDMRCVRWMHMPRPKAKRNGRRRLSLGPGWIFIYKNKTLPVAARFPFPKMTHMQSALLWRQSLFVTQTHTHTRDDWSAPESTPCCSIEALCHCSLLDQFASPSHSLSFTLTAFNDYLSEDISLRWTQK